MCKILHVLIHYFMVATYMWMLCEGKIIYNLTENILKEIDK